MSEPNSGVVHLLRSSTSVYSTAQREEEFPTALDLSSVIRASTLDKVLVCSRTARSWRQLKDDIM